MHIEMIADNLAGLSASIIRRDSPYTSMPICEEVCSKQYLYFVRYFDQLSAELKTKVLDAEVDRSQFQIQKTIIGVNDSFANKFPQHMKTRDEFWKWINKKLMGKSTTTQGMMGQVDPGFDIGKEIKKVVAIKMPLFQFEKNRKYRGFVCFEKDFLDTKIVLLADKGTKRSFISYLIGLKEPDFLIDIALLFSGVQSKFWYSSKNSAIQGINKAIELLSIIMPHFENALMRGNKDK